MRMKHLFLSLMALVAFTVVGQAQADKAQRPSPPMEVQQSLKKVNLQINWNSPAVKGRKVWGELIPYNQVWRTGANEATTISFDSNVKINGKKLAAGRYSLFTIPTESTWTVIFNKEADQWGAYEYKDSEDALRVTVTPTPTTDMAERLVFTADAKGMVTMKWEKMAVSFKVKATK